MNVPNQRASLLIKILQLMIDKMLKIEEKLAGWIDRRVNKLVGFSMVLIALAAGTYMAFGIIDSINAAVIFLVKLAVAGIVGHVAGKAWRRRWGKQTPQQ